MLLSICQNTFQSLVELEAVDSLRVEVRECYAEITKTSEQIQSTVRENYLSKDDLTTIQQDFQTAITQAAWASAEVPGDWKWGQPHTSWSSPIPSIPAVTAAKARPARS